MNDQPANPLHGIKLETILTELLARRGWEDLAANINVRCFQVNPSVKSSLVFLRKTPWARKKVEDLFLYDRNQIAKGYVLIDPSQP